MRAILHIGTEKTGSTTIQAFIRKNLKQFRSEGIEFLKFRKQHTSRPFVTYSLDPDHFDEEVVSQGLREDSKREEWRNDFREEVHRRLSNLPPEIHTVLFSSEHFQSRLVNEAEVARLKSLLDEYFDEYLVILYLRRQDDVARSLYSTSLRTGKVPRRQLLAGKMKGPYFDYLALMNRWADAFGRENILVHKYGRKFFRDGDLLRDFCDACGVENFDSFDRPEEKNQALSATAQAALVELNLHFPGRLDGEIIEFNKFLRRHCTKYLVKHYPGKTLMPSRSEAVEFYENYREGNEEMCRKYFDGEDFFVSDFSNYPEESIDLMEVEGHREALLKAIQSFKRSPRRGGRKRQRKRKNKALEFLRKVKRRLT